MRPPYQHPTNGEKPNGICSCSTWRCGTEQLRQLKTFEPRRLIIQGMTAGGVLMGAGAAIGALFVHLVHG